jgi:hypothetical protein
MANLEKPAIAQTTDDVGYCKPPKAHQWKKGQSGNPAGKKKGVKNFGNQLHKVLSKIVTVKDGGKIKKVTQMELVANAPLVHGMKGDVKNAAHALKLAEEFGLETPEAYPPKPGKVWKSAGGKYCTSHWCKKLTRAEEREQEQIIAHLQTLKPSWDPEFRGG